MNKRTRRFRHLWLLPIALIGAAVILGVAYLVANLGTLSPKAVWRDIRNLFREKTVATEISYSRVDDGAFAPVGGGFVIADPDGVRYVDSTGSETLLEAVNMNSPVAVSNGSEALVFDLGGSYLCVLNRNGIIWSGSASGGIFSASINSAGWVAVCAECPGYNGAVTVFNAKGRSVYRWYSGQGYLLSAAVSEGCDSLAALAVQRTGSAIHFFSLASETEQGCCLMPDTVILDLKYDRQDSVTAITPEALLTIRNDGTEISRTEWPGRYLAAYAFEGDNYTAVAYSDYQVGAQGTLLTVDDRGRLLGSLEIDREVLSISAAGRIVAVRYLDGVVVYDRQLRVLYETSGMSDAVAILAHTDGSFIAAGEYSAEIYGK